MKALTLSSREYKLILNASRFSGDEQQLISSARQFWDKFTHSALLPNIKVKGYLEEPEQKRFITFYDTSHHLLYKNDYIFRLRKSEANQNEGTLKFRHRDRFITQDRNMTTSLNEKSTIKLEHDIKPTFDQLYSYSTTTTLKKITEFEQLKDISRLFPGLADDLVSYSAHDPIRVVNGLEAYEVVFTGGEFFLGKSNDKETKCALIVWYLPGEVLHPIIVEFSFRYKDQPGGYPRQVAWQAYQIFIRLQNLRDWVNLNSPTKTQFVYNWQN